MWYLITFMQGVWGAVNIQGEEKIEAETNALAFCKKNECEWVSLERKTQ